MKNGPERKFSLCYRLLFRLLHRSGHDSLLGDFEEMYAEIALEQGAFRAMLWCWVQLMQLLLSYSKNTIYWRCAMIRNYIKIALRNMHRHKGYSFINISGLAVAMACFILIFLYVQYELSYDQYHENYNQIYRIVCEDRGRMYMNSFEWAQTHPAVVYHAKQEIPEIWAAVRFLFRNEVPLAVESNRYLVDNLYFAEPGLFDVFSFHLLKGDPKTALEDRRAILLSESMAEKFFGGREPLDQTIRMDGAHDLKVTGIFKDIPGNSHFTMDFIVPYRLREVLYGSDINTWEGMCYSYVLLSDDADIGALEQKLDEFPDRYFYENEAQKENRRLKYHLQPISRIHLHSHLNFEIQPNNDIKFILGFLSIAFLILIIACINYMNLATGRASQRFKEVGVRKVFGAGRRHVLSQFLSESILFTMSALVVSIMIVYLTLPYFSAFIERPLSFHLMSKFTFLLGLCGLLFFVGFTAGCYPAVVLASLRPIAVLKSNFRINLRGVSLRKILVVTQFTISTILIVGVLVVREQLHFIRSTDMGYDREQIVVVTVRDENIYDKMETLKTELMRHDRIEAVSLSSNLPCHMDYSLRIHWPGMPDDFHQMMNFAFVDYDFIDLFGIELLEGRNFSRNYSTDADGAYIVNQAAQNVLGWESPVGREFDHYDFMNTRRFITGKIIGVMKDFHFLSMHNRIEPLYLMLNLRPEVMNRSYLSIKMRQEDIPMTLGYIEEQMDKFSPVYPFEYRFFNSVLDSAYREERRIEQMVHTFAGIAIFIACLGLFGLASFTIRQRTKEIGIRKVLGSSVVSILFLLSRSFVKCVLIANVIACPVGYYIMQRWLNGFAYRIPLSWDVFVFSGLLTFMSALLTVGYQSIKAALSNPVDSLRYE